MWQPTVTPKRVRHQWHLNESDSDNQRQRRTVTVYAEADSLHCRWYPESYFDWVRNIARHQRWLLQRLPVYPTGSLSSFIYRLFQIQWENNFSQFVHYNSQSVLICPDTVNWVRNIIYWKPWPVVVDTDRVTQESDVMGNSIIIQRKTYTRQGWATMPSVVIAWPFRYCHNKTSTWPRLKARSACCRRKRTNGVCIVPAQWTSGANLSPRSLFIFRRVYWVCN